jgi:hypothetical protein
MYCKFRLVFLLFPFFLNFLSSAIYYFLVSFTLNIFIFLPLPISVDFFSEYLYYIIPSYFPHFSSFPSQFISTLFSLSIQKTTLKYRTKFGKGLQISFRLAVLLLLHPLFFYDVKTKSVIFISLRFGHAPITYACICKYSVHRFAQHSNLSTT